MSLSDPSRDRRGVAAVEFALAAPLLLLLSLVTADVVLLLRARLRLEQAASQVAQIVAQHSHLYEGDFPQTFLPVAKSAGAGAELECGAGGSIVVTGLDNPSGTTAAKWRWTNAPPGGGCTPTMATAAVGKPSVLGDYAPPEKLSVLVVELTISWSGHVAGRALLGFLDASHASGLLGVLAGPFTVRSYAVAVPRPGTLPPVRTGDRPR